VKEITVETSKDRNQELRPFLAGHVNHLLLATLHLRSGVPFCNAKTTSREQIASSWNGRSKTACGGTLRNSKPVWQSSIKRKPTAGAVAARVPRE